VWDWGWTDHALNYLLEKGIDPIVDLVHYGLPRWIEKAYLNPDFPSYMAEYASRVAERFQGRIHLYTPLNEPRVTAWYCGKLGWWPPNQRGWRGFVKVMLAICRGIALSVEALEEVDPEIVPVHVDATDLYDTNDPSLATECERRQEIVFLALDLISGRVDETHSLYDWLLKNGATSTDLAWFADHKIELPLIGINLYPLFSQKILSRPGGRLRIRMPYSDANIIDRLSELYWERYRMPIFISETASVGSVTRRGKWLDDSVAAVRRVRERGIPCVGYTWWPLFALVTWAYRQGTHPPEFYLKQMGLWDLDPHLDRVFTELVARYRELAQAGVEGVGELRLQQGERMAHVS
jgi:beta-glucosidase/6-phospho-beta-glucosidase/beta-galactosidase